MIFWNFLFRLWTTAPEEIQYPMKLGLSVCNVVFTVKFVLPDFGCSHNYGMEQKIRITSYWQKFFSSLGKNQDRSQVCTNRPIWHDNLYICEWDTDCGYIAKLKTKNQIQTFHSQNERIFFLGFRFYHLGFKLLHNFPSLTNTKFVNISLCYMYETSQYTSFTSFIHVSRKRLHII